MVISVAEKVLIAGGMLNLAYGTLLGYPITVMGIAEQRPVGQVQHPAGDQHLLRY